MLRYLGCAMAVALLAAGTADAAAGGTAGAPAPGGGGPVRVRIGLAGRDPAGLEAFARCRRPAVRSTGTT
ncbi:hypothetical protein KGQ20_28015 [Catenulispora sp. NF23]|uniref:hypothetical protein n=1 Tax=Catenulispora pinistramenti TaxID=2705254 RepID=UPI001BAAC77B|nr:hypothetical protein [Catenulispora pinistramenti]MBS2536613.1 hypothetical protein [Catenulispora pinistramenti]